MRPTHRHYSNESRRYVMVAAVLALVLSGCGEVRKIDEMRDNTGQMNKTTKELLDATTQMNETTKKLLNATGGVKSTTEGMERTTDDVSRQTGELLTITDTRLVPKLNSMNASMAELYDSLRQGDAAALRHSLFLSILNSRTLQNRLAEAGLLLMSFEFQLFNNGTESTTTQTQAQRLILYHQAMMEFMLRLDELAPTGGEIWPDAMPGDLARSPENRASVFNAFAAVLHKLNRKQGADPDFGRPLSVYDLIITSLTTKPKIETGAVSLPAGPHYMKEILARPKRIEQLLQSRYNMFVLLLLGASTDLVETGTFMQLVRVAQGIEIDLSAPTMSAAHLDFLIEEVLKPAVDTRHDMITVGIHPRLTRTVDLLASRIRFKTAIEAGGAMPEKQKLALELWSSFLGKSTETTPVSAGDQ